MDTFGWDTVFVLSSNRVNDALEARRQDLILSFDFGQGSELPVAAKGVFGDWRVVEGGSGEYLYLKILIESGSTTITLGESKTIDIAGMALVVAVALEFLPSPHNPRLEELRFNIQRAGNVGDPPAVGVITPVSLQGGEGRLDPAEQALLLVALARFIAANASAISYVFATVNLVPPSVDSWLTPVRSKYVYASREGGSGALAILSVTQDRSIDGLSRSVDSTLLSTSYDGSFGISRELFLSNVILPSLPQVFGHGTSLASFAYDVPGGAIVNTQTIGTDGITYGAITYYPEIQRLSIRTTGSGLESSYEGWCDLKAGISMKFWITARNSAVYVNKAIAFTPDGGPSSHHEADIPWYWFIGGLIVAAIVEILVPFIANGIAEKLTRFAGDQIAMTRNPPTSVQWTETSAMDVQFAGVNDGFYMQGGLGPRSDGSRAYVSANRGAWPTPQARGPGSGSSPSVKP